MADQQKGSTGRIVIPVLVGFAIIGSLSWLAWIGMISLVVSWVVGVVCAIVVGVIYWTTDLIDKDEKSIPRLCLFIVLTIFLQSFPTVKEFWAFSPDEDEFEVVLLGESQSPATQPHWKSFVDGFEMVLNDKERGMRRNNSDGKSSVGNFWIKKANEDKKISVNVRFEPIPQDGTAKQNDEALTAKVNQLVSNKKVLMVIGFVTSTKAQTALNALETAKTKNWPVVILPMATVSKLVEGHNSYKDRPILRIVPSNRLQIDSIANQILKTKDGKPSITLAIFRDQNNSDYSADLAGELRKKVERNGVAVVFDGTVGPNGSGSYVTDSFLMLQPDYIVFLGMLDTGVPLVRQIRLMGQGTRPGDSPRKLPTILLADGSVEKAIEEYARKDELKGIYGFFPHGKPIRYPKELVDKSVLDSPSFTMFGYDAALFAQDILQTAEDGKDKFNRKSVAQALIIVREGWKNKKSRIQDDVLVGDYSFNDYGDAEGMDFHLWQFNGSKWILMPSQSN